jgi:hypothetical protein
MQLEGLGVVDLLRLRGRACPAVHVRLGTVETLCGAAGPVFWVGPSVRGIDVEEDVDDFVKQLVSDTNLGGRFGTYKGRG